MARIRPETVSATSAPRPSSHRTRTPPRSTSEQPSPSPSQQSDKENSHRGSNMNVPEPAAKRQRLETPALQPLTTETQAARLQCNPDLQYYDPNQDIEERRAVRKGLRDLNREAADLRPEWMAPGSDGLRHAVLRADNLIQSVRQTSDATMESRFLVTAADITDKKTQQAVLGDGAQGIDVDDFVSKCIIFMKRGPGNGAEPSSTQRQRRQTNAGVDDEEEEEGLLERGDGLNWEFFGARACFPSNSRPPVPGFLLGPLSVQKRARVVRAPRARLQRAGPNDTVRPEELKAADLEQQEAATLSAQCKVIFRDFKKLYLAFQQACEVDFNDRGEVDDAEMTKLMMKHNLGLDGGISLFRFALNPWSFGQSVENLFYVSFLIKEGKLGIEIDENGLPGLHTRNEDADPADANGRPRHQSVFTLDFDSWKEMVEVFDIQRPLIPHRTPEDASTQIGTRGWYS